MNEESIDMEISCRACLQVDAIMVHIYEEVEDLNSDLSKLLEKCGGLKVDKDDSFPKYLCKQCTTELLISASFRQKCERTQKVLEQVDAELKAVKMQEDLIDEQTKSERESECEYNVYDIKVVREEDEVEVEVNVEPSDTKYQGKKMQDARTLKESKELEDMVLFSAVDDEKDQEAEEYEIVESLIEEIPEESYTEPSREEEMVPENDFTQEINDDSNASELIVYEFDDSPYAVENEVVVDDEKDEEITIDCESAQTIRKPVKSSLLQYICDVCGAMFIHGLNLKRHMDKEHASAKIRICCTCQHCFSIEDNYVKHCRTCRLDTNIASNTNQNNTVHSTQTMIKQMYHATSKSLKQCQYCDKTFTSTFALTMHERTHTGERPFECDICSKTFKTQSTLQTHLKRHAGKPDYSCELCNKRFYETSNLVAHMRTHTGEKPHKCTLCPKSFTRVFLLQLHMRTHTGERPYQCKQCERSFAQLCDLNYHVRTHTQERRYKCTVCPKTFIKRYPMMMHMRKHAMLGLDVDGAVADVAHNEQNDINDAVASIADDYSNNSREHTEVLEHEFNFNDLIEEDV